MTTTYENMVVKETQHREEASKKEWGIQHGSDSMLYPMDSVQFAKLSKLKDDVADLCDLQPTSSSMVRPARKTLLKGLKAELESALADCESELEQLGGSASTVSRTTAKSAATAKSNATKKSFASTQPPIAE